MTRHKQIAQVSSEDEIHLIIMGLSALVADRYYDTDDTSELRRKLENAHQYQEIFNEVQQMKLDSVMSEQVMDILLKGEGLDKDD